MRHLRGHRQEPGHRQPPPEDPQGQRTRGQRGAAAWVYYRAVPERLEAIGEALARAGDTDAHHPPGRPTRPARGGCPRRRRRAGSAGGRLPPAPRRSRTRVRLRAARLRVDARRRVGAHVALTALVLPAGVLLTSRLAHARPQQCRLPGRRPRGGLPDAVRGALPAAGPPRHTRHCRAARRRRPSRQAPGRCHVGALVGPGRHQRHRHLGPPLRARLPGSGDVRGPAAAQRAVHRPAAVRRPAGRHRRRRQHGRPARSSRTSRTPRG